MKPETKRMWAIIALVIFALIIIGEIGNAMHPDTCDDQCQLQRQQERLQCLYDNRADC